MFTSIALFFAKYAIGRKIASTASFIFAHWQAFVVLGILGYCLWQWRGAVNERDYLAAWKTSYLTQQKELTDTRKLQNELAKLEGKKNAEMIAAKRQLDLDRFNLANIEREQLRKKVSVLNENLNHTENRLADTQSNLAQRMSIDAERYRIGVSEEPSAAEGLADGGRECDGTAAEWQNIIAACRLTTIDFNSCRAALDNDTAVVGRDE